MIGVRRTRWGWYVVHDGGTSYTIGYVVHDGGGSYTMVARRT